MENIKEKVLEAKNFINKKIKSPYEIGLLTGTGLATITNINNPDAPQKATLEEIIDTAQR